MAFYKLLEMACLPCADSPVETPHERGLSDVDIGVLLCGSLVPSLLRVDARLEEVLDVSCEDLAFGDEEPIRRKGKCTREIQLGGMEEMGHIGLVGCRFSASRVASGLFELSYQVQCFFVWPLQS